MIWLSWRQQRMETALAALILAVLAAVFIPVGVHLASVYASDGISHCINRNRPVCAAAFIDFGHSSGTLSTLLPWLILLPGIIGASLAAPLLLEFERGTYRLAWTQSVTRGRWLATRLSFAIVTTIVAAGLLTALISWYREPLDKVYGSFGGASTFDIEGIVPIEIGRAHV